MRFSTAWLFITAMSGICSTSQAGVLTYEFTGITFGLPHPSASQTSFTGRVSWDTSVPDSNAFMSDLGAYPHQFPYGAVGLSLTTDTGLSITHDPRETGQSTFLSTTFVQGGTFPQDEVRFEARRATVTAPAGTLPAGVTAQSAAMNLTLKGALDGSWLAGSDAIPNSLPEFLNGIAPAVLHGVPLLDIQLYSTAIPVGIDFHRITGILLSLEHVGTSDSANLTAGASTVSAAGGSTTNGGVTAEFSPESEGTFSVNYSVVDVDDLPGGVAFSPGVFLLDVPNTQLQYWDIGFSGLLTDSVWLTFNFDPTLFSTTEEFGIWHYDEVLGWEYLGGEIVGNTITVQTDSFSPFALANAPLSPVPEPSSMLLVWLGVVGVVVNRIGGRHCRRSN